VYLLVTQQVHQSLVRGGIRATPAPWHEVVDVQLFIVIQGRATVPAPTVLPLGVSLVDFRKREVLFSPTLLPIVLKSGVIWRRSSFDQDVSPDGCPGQS
jgi:hypothetical protein